MKRGAVLLEAVVALGIVSIVLGGAALILGRANGLQEQSRRLRSVARLEEGLDASLRAGWSSRAQDEVPGDASRRRVAFTLEFEGVVSLVVLQQSAADPLIAEVSHASAAGLLDGYRPLGRIITAREQAVDAFGVPAVGALQGESRGFVVEALDESIAAGIPAPPFDFSWEVTDNPQSERDIAEVTGALDEALTSSLRDGIGITDLNGNGILERPLRAKPPPAPLLLTNNELDLVTDPRRLGALRAWFSERLGRVQATANLKELAAMERLAFRRRRLARDSRDPYRKLCWRVEGGAFFADPSQAGGVDADRLILRVAAYEDAVARRSGVLAEPLKVWEVELSP